MPSIPAPGAAETPPAASLPRLLAAIQRANAGRPPVWYMRQAGRYLPEYRQVRRGADFLTMVRTPELATEVTLQPVELIGVDAAIIFSDILVVPAAMGMELTVEEGVGPRFPVPLRDRRSIEALALPDVEEAIAYTLDALRLTRRALDGAIPLIGFAGAPWTLASYMVEGEGTRHFHVVKHLLFSEPAVLHLLLERLTRVVGDFLIAQVRAGAQVVQLFDSWASALAPEQYAEFALPYVRDVVVRVRQETGTPVIVFAPGAGASLDAMARVTGAEVIGIDWQTEWSVARALAARHRVAIQGNLDPCALFGTPDDVMRRTNRMLQALHSPEYIANLGHGVLPNTPVENARAFVDAVKAFVPGEGADGAASPPSPKNA